jgi:hypothetical protein
MTAETRSARRVGATRLGKASYLGIGLREIATESLALAKVDQRRQRQIDKSTQGNGLGD